MLPKISPTKTREFRPLKMSTKISVKNALLLQVLLLFLLLATFVTTAVAWKNDLVLNRDIETPLIDIHRVKRDFWTELFVDSTNTDSTTSETWETTGICEIKKFACDVSRCIGTVDHTCDFDLHYLETTTTTDVPEGERDPEAKATRCMKPVLKVLEKEIAGTDKPNKLHEPNAEFKELIAANECFEKEYSELWKKLAGIEQRLKDHDLRIAHLVTKVSDRSATPFSESERKFTELECRAFVTNLIMSQKKYFP